MVMYRRNRIAGGSYFLTITLRDRSSSLLVERIQDLRAALASVVLPDHLHALWGLPPGDDDYRAA